MYDAALDVSLEETAICVVTAPGRNSRSVVRVVRLTYGPPASPTAGMNRHDLKPQGLNLSMQSFY